METIDLKKIQEKVKKLLALSSSPNPAEASLAMEKCKELMEKYGLRTVDVDPIRMTADIKVDKIDGMTCTLWEKILATIVARSFDAQAIIERDAYAKQFKIVFVGGNSDLDIVVPLFTALRRTISFNGKVFTTKRATNKRAYVYKSYCMGMVDSIDQNLQKVYGNNEAGLVVVKKGAIDEKLKELGAVSGKKSKATFDGQSYHQGIKDGQNIGVTTQFIRG